MKCDKCPFHLPCFMGRLGGGDGAERALCPTCEKLELLGEDLRDDKGGGVIMIYKFICEKRTVTPEIHQTFERHVRMARARARSQGGHAIPAYLTPDPVDDRKIKVAECLHCGNSPMLRMAHLRFVDLDADWEDEERRKRHVFRLRTSRDD